MKKYLFTSERLGFRNWEENDLDQFAEMNADPEVMEHFPNELNKEESAAFITRLQDHYSKNGHTYYAVETLENGEWIGFVGLALQEYVTPFTPAVDIGWRLKKSAWGNGYATEGAKRCLSVAFIDLKLKKIIATIVEGNSKSENVMKKIGMSKMGHFKHPRLKDFPEYENCIWYEIKA